MRTQRLSFMKVSEGISHSRQMKRLARARSHVVRGARPRNSVTTTWSSDDSGLNSGYSGRIGFPDQGPARGRIAVGAAVYQPRRQPGREMLCLDKARLIKEPRYQCIEVHVLPQATQDLVDEDLADAGALQVL